MLDFLRDEGVSPQIIAEVEAFRAKYPVGERLAARVPVSRYLYYGKDVWEEAATALLCGENLLLVGPKATGKNVLAENLACVFGRPSWDVSMYVNVDAASLVDVDLTRFDIADAKNEPGFDNSYDFVLDSNGYVIAIRPAEEVVTNYALVVDSAWTLNALDRSGRSRSS